ncbi:signal recognition particle receptor beta subunit-domain-containing protein [Xylariomycetidae sp. FL0641]|nr:signal recognition particle receptor beta subunit-domain-containing protein [Xylariomycetidae sp. FL0641]
MDDLKSMEGFPTTTAEGFNSSTDGLPSAPASLQALHELKHVLEYILTPSPPVILVGLAIVFLVPLVVHWAISRGTPYTSLPSILLAGPPGGGKTALLTLLERGTAGAAATHTSQTPAAVELTASTDAGAATFREAARDDAPGAHAKFLLVDTPGHGKLRAGALGVVHHPDPNPKTGNPPMLDGKGAPVDGATPDQLRGVVFVLDAAALGDDAGDGLADAAHYLYEVLLGLQRRAGAGKTSRAPGPVPVLVAANKADLFTALPAALVRGRLEAELGRIRGSRRKGLLDSGVGADDVGSEEQDDWLGAYGTDKFAFAQMREFDVEVDVLGGSVLEGDVDKWWKWIVERI